MVIFDWSATRSRIARIAAQASSGRVFGASSHEWKVESPLSSEDLAELEAQLGVELPGEYRSFLLYCGRGGAGPAYGLFPARRMGRRWEWEGDGADLTDLDQLSTPFEHVEAFNPADGLPEPPDEEAYDSEDAFNAAEDVYWEQHDRVAYAPEHSVGLLYLSHLGCALREALVISGPARGTMWADDTADDGGFRPLLDEDGTPLTFARWYQRWLDLAEAQVAAGS
ncbi:SMI1/KNR4 family protein [Longispora fulva]|uniref:Knr4/Smi1-like domain-containing protein n=1 Tax=Longispora fulva TaxID=619741 RepID=A0A8J7G9Y0_9ACTN|nr:SMI1/KNR4 family protein [Longispora fulva]MBG6136488.1 hypothetical protein [Longispora fulva]